MKKSFVISYLLFIFNLSLFSQIIITGKIYDKDIQQALEGVEIICKTTNTGTLSDVDGNFLLNTNKPTDTLIFKRMAYQGLQIPIRVNDKKLNLGKIYLTKTSFQLAEYIVSANITNQKTPVSFVSISSKEIKASNSDLALPLIISKTPSLFAVRNGGGSGDARLNLRGFNQENISILLDGIPVNGIENGLMYWSNWIGLASSFGEIQIQKGVGISNFGINSVGGTINIIPSKIRDKEDNFISLGMTDYGNNILSISLQTPFEKKGWNLHFVGSKSWGEGYVEATYLNSWSYFINLQKQFSNKSKLSIILIGAPQKHGQRNLKLSNQEVKLYGYQYNKDWGILHGKTLNASENFYHKPMLITKYQYIKSTKLRIINKFYAGYGTGGGRWSESFNYAPTIFEYRNNQNNIDWQEITNQNVNHQETYTLNSGKSVSGYSINVLTNFIASHYQVGNIAGIEYHPNNKTKITTGIHYRYFHSFVQEKISDLLGGDFFIDDYAWAIEGAQGRDEIKYPGDIIKVNNQSKTHFMNLFTQYSYTYKRINSFFAANLNLNQYQRLDSYNYIQHIASKPYTKLGYNFKGGLAYEFSTNYQLFINGAYFSRVPYFKYVFGNFNNTQVSGLQNETITTIELGNRINFHQLRIEISLFQTQRNNVSLLTNEYIQFETQTQSKAMINGLRSLHQGIEITLHYPINKLGTIGGFASLGNYQYLNDVQANFYNQNQQLINTQNIFASTLKIGGTAQTQYSIYCNTKLFNTININVDWSYFDNMYANFNPVLRTNANDRKQSFKLPAYQLLNARASTTFEIEKTKIDMQISVSNILNEHYLETGEDGINHDMESFRGFWSFGRNFHIGLNLHL